ncbi:hypothetical protein GCM10027521_03440 [Amycolatopsis cihanbeyliensis]
MQKSTLNWVPLDRDTYRVTFDGRVWILRRTPTAKRPWLLHTKCDGRTAGCHCREQEIGVSALADAQRVAEVWLDMSSPRYGLSLWDEDHQVGGHT